MRARDIPVTPTRGRIERPPISRQPVTPQILDRDLTVFRDGVRWSFSDNKVLIDGQEVSPLITHNPAEVSVWMGLAEGLSEYRKQVSAVARERDQFARFEAVVEALLGKIMGRLKKVYDQKITGISWTLQNGQLVLNGINIRSFLALYRLRKTDKAKKFLKNLRGKLALLLENRNESPDNERIREVIEGIYQEMDEALEANQDQPSPRSPRRLLPGGAHVS